MAFKLPWSNFHELNLDWLLEKMKELEEKVNNIVGGATPATNTPNMDGVGSPGSSISYSRGDHTHPTDTSRASVADLNALDNTVYNNYVELNGSINTVDAKIAFSSAAPQVDGVASPGSSAYQARADHVHPTDTSRASQTQVDTLQATVDSWQGSASPYGLTPEMDGTGSAGTVDSYSRGDHKHPSDTSKLDKAGGEITGNLTVDGYSLTRASMIFPSTSASGWLRVAYVPRVKGTHVDINIEKATAEDAGFSETHTISFLIRKNTFDWLHELSSGDEKNIEQIRYTDAGYLDIYVGDNSLFYIGISLDIYPTTEAVYTNIKCENPPSWVDAVPAGETILSTHAFLKNTASYSILTAVGKSWRYSYQDGVVMLSTLDAAGSAISAGSQAIATLPELYRPKTEIAIPCANNPNLYIRIRTTGIIMLYLSSALAVGDPCAFTATWTRV